MPNIVIYPGSFDPVTYGHLDLIERANGVFSKVIVAVARNIHKKPMFSLQERVEMLKIVTKKMPRVSVESFDGLVVDYAKSKKANIMLRGLRMISDFEHEFQMAFTNRKLDEKIETVFLMPSEKYSYLSSSMLKEIASMGADISLFVPKEIEKRLKERLKRISKE